MNVDKMQLHLLLRLHPDSADLTRFASRNFVFVMILDVQVHAEFLSESLAWTKWTLVSFLTGVDSMMATKTIKIIFGQGLVNFCLHVQFCDIDEFFCTSWKRAEEWPNVIVGLNVTIIRIFAQECCSAPEIKEFQLMIGQVLSLNRELTVDTENFFQSDECSNESGMTWCQQTSKSTLGTQRDLC